MHSPHILFPVACRLALESPPIGASDAVKDRVYKVMMEVLTGFKTSEIEKTVKSLSPVSRCLSCGAHAYMCLVCLCARTHARTVGHCDLTVFWHCLSHSTSRSACLVCFYSSVVATSIPNHHMCFCPVVHVRVVPFAIRSQPKRCFAHSVHQGSKRRSHEIRVPWNGCSRGWS